MSNSQTTSHFNLKDHFERGKRETINDMKEKLQVSGEAKEMSVLIKEANIEKAYHKVTHECLEWVRMFEIDKPMKCPYCGEVIK